MTFCNMKLLLLAPLLPTALAWGAAGHEIVATIAQIHLFPSVREQLCTILPPEAKCHLAPIAAWADTIRGRYRMTAGMHYVNPMQDHPQDHCEFGEHGWINEDVNVLTAITNKTQMLMDGDGDFSLRFLVHFLGDLHQPLHLTGRLKGGNDAHFKFEGRFRSLHSVWDSGILTKNIRELGNYTTPLPSKHIEASLPGAIFDPYVRWIVWEGIREWWTDSVDEWLECPVTDPYPHSSNSAIPASPSPFIPEAISKGATAVFQAALPGSIFGYLAGVLALPSPETDNLRAKSLQLAANAQPFPACPFTWSKPIHAINCDVAWPKEYTGEPGQPLIELDTDEYLGRISREKTVEHLLAMGGLRLAKVLNEIYGEKGVYRSY